MSEGEKFTGMSEDEKEQGLEELEEADNQQREMSEELQTSPAESNLVKSSVSEDDDVSSDDEMKKAINNLTKQIELYLREKKIKKFFTEEREKNKRLAIQLTETKKCLAEKDTKIAELKQELANKGKKIKATAASTPKKKTRCGSCENCLKPDCMECIFCRDKYEGENKLKQSCIQRRCLILTYPSLIPPTANSPACTATVSNCGPNVDDISSGMDQLNLSASDIRTSASSVHEERLLDAPGEPTGTLDVEDEDSEDNGLDCVKGTDDDKNI